MFGASFRKRSNRLRLKIELGPWGGKGCCETLKQLWQCIIQNAQQDLKRSSFWRTLLLWNPVLENSYKAEQTPYRKESVPLCKNFPTRGFIVITIMNYAEILSWWTTRFSELTLKDMYASMYEELMFGSKEYEQVRIINIVQSGLQNINTFRQHCYDNSARLCTAYLFRGWSGSN